MHLLKQVAAGLLFTFLVMTGCKKDAAFPLESEGNTTSNNGLSTPSAARLSPALKAKLQKLRTSLPAGYEKRLSKIAPTALKLHPEYRNMVYKGVKVITPTPCDDNLKLYQWLYMQLADWDDDVFFFAIYSGMLDFPAYDAYYFENTSQNQYFGVKGEYTHPTTKGFKDLRRFWNIQSNNMVLAAMHGSMLQNREKLIRIDKIIFGDGQATAEFWADLILLLIKEVPQYRGGNHPIFTFNAFAANSFNFPPYGIVPDKIIMGDGIIDGYKAIGYEDVASQAVLAHEYGHHIQFQLNLFGNEYNPESTRRTELMADAFSAYYLSHARGATMQWKRVKQFLQVFFNIGDCQFDNNNHHGTPLQRMAAAEWAYNVANNAQKQGHILTSQQFVKLFDAQLPNLVK